MKLKSLVYKLAFLLLMATALGALYLLYQKDTVENCRKVVIKDMRAQSEFRSQMAILLPPGQKDFLTELSEYKDGR